MSRSKLDVCPTKGQRSWERKPLLEAGDSPEQKDDGHSRSQEESGNHIRRVVLVVHNAGSSNRPRKANLRTSRCQHTSSRLALSVSLFAKGLESHLWKDWKSSQHLVLLLQVCTRNGLRQGRCTCDWLLHLKPFIDFLWEATKA